MVSFSEGYWLKSSSAAPLSARRGLEGLEGHRVSKAAIDTEGAQSSSGCSTRSSFCAAPPFLQRRLRVPRHLSSLSFLHQGVDFRAGGDAIVAGQEELVVCRQLSVLMLDALLEVGVRFPGPKN